MGGGGIGGGRYWGGRLYQPITLLVAGKFHIGISLKLKGPILPLTKKKEERLDMCRDQTAVHNGYCL